MAGQLPYQADYAKSSKAACRACKGNIMKDNLRLAVMVQSPYFDGKQPNWYHYTCFWKLKKKHVTSTSEIGHFDTLRWDDQEKIRKVIDGAGSYDGSGTTDYGVEYAKSNRSSCKACGDKIGKDEVRISFKSTAAAEAKGLQGSLVTWYHVSCFVKPPCLAEVKWQDWSVEKIEGFQKLADDDKNALKKAFELKIKAKGTKASSSVDEPDSKKPKLQKPKLQKPKLQKHDDSYKDQLQAQSKFVWKIRDELQKNVTPYCLKAMLTANKQAIPVGESNILDRVSDIMVFGPTKPCTECDQGQFSLTTGGYACRGNMSSWTKCTVFLQEPKRAAKLVIADECEEDDYLTSFKFKSFNGGKRIFPKDEPKPGSSSVTPSRNDKTPLVNVEIATAGKLSMSVTTIKQTVEKLGGTYSTAVSATTTCIISNQAEIKKHPAKISKAKTLGVHVVSMEFLEEIEKGGDVLKLIPQHSIAPWGSQLEDRVGKTATDGPSSTNPPINKPLKSCAFPTQSRKRRYDASSKSVGGVKKLQLKGGAAVDPESKLEDVCHVLKEHGMLFGATLGMVDVTRGSNSYYKLQLLESDESNEYWLFRSWGRVGTDIGGSKVTKFHLNKIGARRKFVDLYLEKTGNPFNTKNLQKIPNKFYPLDIDYGDDEVAKLRSDSQQTESKLHQQIQGLINLIFDIDTLKKTMVEFEIDLDRMPLGKLSRAQIQNAYSVLAELQTLIEAGNISRNAMLDASNRFYTLIPHNFGHSIDIPLLDTLEVVQNKAKMVDSLLEIEVAYSLLKASKEDQAGNKNPIDVHYENLKCPMEVVPQDSDEFKMIEKYTQNTHAATHSSYKLIVEEVFCLDRDGEAAPYKPFKKLHNRMLLWHGSRLSNFCGILSQGLRIAPPEAPTTGYMFGKGVYFADMVSKSANYCFTNRYRPAGLMLLCEVAIGDSHELTGSSYITELPKGKHSTKGKGRTAPDPSGTITLDDGVIVPTGKGTNSGVASTNLLYNEFIVYDVAQIRMKYLIKMNFDYN